MEQFFDATTDAVVFLDRQYNFTFLNLQAQKLLLSPGDTLLGKNIYELFPMAQAPDAPFARAYARTMEEGVISQFDGWYPDPLNRWFRNQSYPSIEGIMIVFRDVTQEKLDLAALRRSTQETERQHAEIETIYRTAPIGLALFDLDDYHYLRLNDLQAAFFGLKPQDIVGKTVTQMAPIEGLRELFDQVARGEPVINYPLEGSLVTDPDTHRYWMVSYFPVYGTDGKVQAITAASLEITAQKKAEQALIQSEKLALVGRLASSIAHEINNPLESVTNLLYLAQHSDSLDDVRLHLALAETELRRVAAITSQTLRFHRQASSPQEVPPKSLLESSLAIFQGRIHNAPIKIIERVTTTEPLRCFEGEIRQVISNLIGNALDALGPEGGTIQLRAREATNWHSGGKGVIFTVADNGSGISDETMQKLFSVFFTTKGSTGTGLGLWVSKEIIDRHHGTLRIRSTQDADNHGTVFSIFLPYEAVVR